MLSPQNRMLALAAALWSTITPAQAQLYEGVVDTTLGPVRGFKYFNNSTLLEKYFGISESTVSAFLGIPYAADTAYENRWKPAQPRQPWNTTFNATAFGPACPNLSAENYSEDCLSVNIWTNANSSLDNLPVLVWNQGSDETSNNTWWYGGGMALEDVVFVSFNRRDDVLGYLALPELQAEGLERTGHNTSGVYGILDHLSVLQWVQDNIRNFGGDPEKVTIAGQSFGSSQVYHAVNSGLFKGLFRGAISQSGIRYPYDTLVAALATSYVEMDTAINFGLNYTASHNVSTLAELRALPLEDILVGSADRDSSLWYITALSTGNPLIFKPALDNYAIPMKYIAQLKQGPANDVPLITGNTKDESGASPSNNYTVKEYTEYCTLKYGNLSSRYFDLYPSLDNATTCNMAWNAAARDTSLVSSWAYSNGWVLSAQSPIYTYYWDHAPPGQDQGAFHQSEIMYALNALYANDAVYPFTDVDLDIGKKMTSYWVNFIKTLDPNGVENKDQNDLPRWYPNDGSSEYVMHLGDGFGNYSVANPERVDLIMD